MRDDVIHPLVNGKTWGRVEDTPLLPQLPGARKVGECAEMKDGRLGKLAAVSERNDDY